MLVSRFPGAEELQTLVGDDVMITVGGDVAEWPGRIEQCSHDCRTRPRALNRAVLESFSAEKSAARVAGVIVRTLGNRNEPRGIGESPA
jgi:hypothetical protein